MNPVLSSVRTGFTNVLTNRIFQVVFVLVIVVGLIYYIGFKAARNKLIVDQVDVSKLPSKDDKVENITREELDEIVTGCRHLFNDFSAVTTNIELKEAMTQRLLALTDYELGLVNNNYNNLWAKRDTNLLNEITDDFGYSYRNSDARKKLITRLTHLPRK